ncbi:hypothetical protein QO004_003472 [Rhizobium mesoamericanum]|nr:hypothetical protein [Rhizobium mesoamericanum]
MEALTDRSRRPVRYANQLPEPVEAANNQVVLMDYEFSEHVFDFWPRDVTSLR